ncbi:Uncharacterised protein [Streptococcus pneumoniae]|nr:Uncharacterised protein [Streptococcus pneumoniae]
MDAIFDLIGKGFQSHLRNGWTCHHVNHFDSIGFTFWSEILQSA